MWTMVAQRKTLQVPSRFSTLKRRAIHVFLPLCPFAARRRDRTVGCLRGRERCHRDAPARAWCICSDTCCTSGALTYMLVVLHAALLLSTFGSSCAVQVTTSLHEHLLRRSTPEYAACPSVLCGTCKRPGCSTWYCVTCVWNVCEECLTADPARTVSGAM